MDTASLFSRFMPVRPEYGFEMDGYWVWCGSAIQDDDELWHMYSARWSKQRPFMSGYVTSSEIVHAVSDTPYGPYRFSDIVLPDRGERFWDGRMTHNPSVLRCGDRYLLFYIGSTYRGPRPSGEELRVSRPACIDECYDHIAIGLATSASPYGPWERSDAPVLTASPDSWDRTIVTNPAPCLCSDGSILLYYRSNTPQGLRIGVARAKHCGAPFVRCTDTPLFSELEGLHVEDPFAWQSGDRFELIAKDMTGTGCGERWGGVHLISEDGIRFRYAEDRLAYSRTLLFSDGTRRTAFHLERPNITFRNGRPFFLSAAYGIDGAGLPPCGNPAFDTMTLSKTLVIPIA